ncbi:MAG: hypothetical protein M1368_11450 [Thaumarchaeota archaeon]|nr:hypothetical protein [Nitrososphaerota archaeon]
MIFKHPIFVKPQDIKGDGGGTFSRASRTFSEEEMVEIVNEVDRINDAVFCR